MKWFAPKTSGLILSALLLAAPAVAQEQISDPSFRPAVARPAYAGEGPLIQLDAAHGSVQTIDGRYAGFAALARADGYQIRAGEQVLDAPGALDGVDVLVISNAVRPADGSRPDAFTASEIAVLEAWVREGGALLLAADHAPYGSANEALGRAFGVAMGKGYAFVQTPEGPLTNLDYPAEALGDRARLCTFSAIWRRSLAAKALKVRRNRGSSEVKLSSLSPDTQAYRTRSSSG